MNRCLTLHKAISEDLEKQVQEGQSQLADLFQGMKYFIIPSFYRLILNLRKNKREFAICFRSFGQDLPQVINEFNTFCEGRHPCYNGKNGTPLVRFDGQKNSKDLRLQEQSYALSHRLSENLKDSYLILGTFDRPPIQENPNEYFQGQIEEGNIQVYQDGVNWYVGLMEHLKQNCTIAIKDHYETGEKSCVDCRNLITGETIPYYKVKDKYLVRVDPFRAMTEQDYFVKAFDVCEANRTDEIQRIELGLPSDGEEAEEEVQTPWEKLQQLPTREYLQATILPVLYPALNIIDIERPEDPVAFLAMYILTHQHLANIPKP